MQKMISRLIEQEKAIKIVLSSDRTASHLMPTWQDMDVWDAINDALLPLAEFTDVMSGEKYVTGSAILPIIHLIETKVLKENSEDKTLTNDIRSAIKSDLLTRNTSDQVVNLLEICSFVDPRFKTKYVRNESALKDQVIAEGVATHPADSQQENLSDDNPDNTSDEAPVPKKKKRTLGSLLKSNDDTGIESDSEVSIGEKVNQEVSTYLKVPRLDYELDPLEWWKNNESAYPTLAKLAKKYLTVPATSASSERLFSKSGKVVTPLRASLKPDKVEQLVFLAKNIK